jgi:peptidoglycan hydrolase-like protein with peptidoglycan-binding domain
VLTIRASLALALFTALAARPSFGTTAPPASASKPATHTAQTHAAQTHTAPAHTAQTHTAQAHGAQTSAAQTHGTQARGTHKGKSRARRPRGQQAMEPSRITEIQQALIRKHYLSGEANGVWDERSKAAMQKYQADQGWQTKLAPDARALKKLGLGPDYSNAINAKNSSFAEPPPVSTIPPAVTAGFATAAGVK